MTKTRPPAPLANTTLGLNKDNADDLLAYKWQNVILAGLSQ